MNTVGIRELKAHLSRHLRHVRSGARLLVTERGRAVATISPVVETDGLAWARALVAAGQARSQPGVESMQTVQERIGQGNILRRF